MTKFWTKTLFWNSNYYGVLQGPSSLVEQQCEFFTQQVKDHFLSKMTNYLAS